MQLSPRAHPPPCAKGTSATMMKRQDRRTRPVSISASTIIRRILCLESSQIGRRFSPPLTLSLSRGTDERSLNEIPLPPDVVIKAGATRRAVRLSSAAIQVPDLCARSAIPHNHHGADSRQVPIRVGRELRGLHQEPRQGRPRRRVPAGHAGRGDPAERRSVGRHSHQPGQDRHRHLPARRGLRRAASIPGSHLQERYHERGQRLQNGDHLSRGPQSDPSLRIHRHRNGRAPILQQERR